MFKPTYVIKLVHVRCTRNALRVMYNCSHSVTTSPDYMQAHVMLVFGGYYNPIWWWQ